MTTVTTATEAPVASGTAIPRLPQALGQRIDIRPTLEALREPILRGTEHSDHARRLPQDLVDTLWEAGIFSTTQPREIDGIELHPIDYMDLIFELSRLDGSVGWIGIFQKGSLPLLPSPVMRELKEQGGGRLLFASSHSAVGKAVKVEGGYRVSGNYPFATGAQWSTHLTVWVDVFDEAGKPIIVEETGEQLRLDAVVPQSAITYRDNWHVLGLRGTGSAGFTVDDYFVPERFAYDGAPPEEYTDRPFLVTPQAAEAAAMALGVAQGAIDRYIEYGRRVGKKPDPTWDEMRRIRLAGAEAKIRGAREMLWNAARVTLQSLDPDSVPAATSLITVADQNSTVDYLASFADEMGASVAAVQAAKEAVYTILDISSTVGVREEYRIERCARDLFTAATHAGNSYRNLSMRGDYLVTKDLPEGPVIDIPPALY